VAMPESPLPINPHPTLLIMRLQNKVTLVTGAAAGIGAEIATRFAAEGAQVLIGDFDEVSGKETAGRICRAGGRTRFVPLDVTQEASWLEALNGIRTAEGRLDVLVNNAGITKRIPITEMPLSDFESVMAVNVRGVFLGIKHALPLMKTHGGGSIVNISSIAGRGGSQVHQRDAIPPPRGP